VLALYAPNLYDLILGGVGVRAEKGCALCARL
jgi:hypothetical protein